MDTISDSDARAQLAKTMDKVCDDHTSVIITRKSSRSVVMMSLEDYQALGIPQGQTRTLLQVSYRNKLGNQSFNPLGRTNRRKIEVHLQIHPKFRRGIKRLCQQPCRIWRNPSLTPYELINSLYCNSKMLRKFGLR